MAEKDSDDDLISKVELGLTYCINQNSKNARG